MLFINKYPNTQINSRQTFLVNRKILTVVVWWFDGGDEPIEGGEEKNFFLLACKERNEMK